MASVEVLLITVWLAGMAAEMIQHLCLSMLTGHGLLIGLNESAGPTVTVVYGHAAHIARFCQNFSNMQLV